jgi:FdhD protein
VRKGQASPDRAQSPKPADGHRWESHASSDSSTSEDHSPRESLIALPVHVVTPDLVDPQSRAVIEERPLRIVVNGEPVATLIRTPGTEVELALGFLLTEGLIRSRADVGTVSFCDKAEPDLANEVHVRLAEGAPRVRRGRYRDVLSSCSLCGDAWLDRAAEDLSPFQRPTGRLRIQDVIRLRERMAAAQTLFERTGAAHAAALTERPVPKDGGGVIVREDLGRHNALDKAVGAALAADFRLDRALLFLSSRLSFEMVVKAARAGLADVAGVSAPSAAAIRLAQRLRMFLAGFARGETMTVYAGLDALRADPGAQT